jgi:multidrug efflux pump
VAPLVLAHGAGAEMRRSLGIAVFAGMIGVTSIGVFLTPVFFYVIQTAGAKGALASAASRRASSYLLGTSLGAAFGYLLSRLGVVQMNWGVAIGAVAGLLTIFTVLAVSRRGPNVNQRKDPSSGAL